MIAGHFGFAAIVKGIERRTPLWILMLAAVWLDIVFVPLYLAGVETIEPAAGAVGSYGGGIIHADYTHSLVGAIVLSVALGVLAAFAWGKRSGAFVAFVAFSHWLLDLVVHRADMPLLPANLGNLPLLGFGLWRLPSASIIVELVLVLLGAWVYGHAARDIARQNKRGKILATTVAGLIALCGILVLYLDASGAGGSS